MRRPSKQVQRRTRSSVPRSHPGARCDAYKFTGQRRRSERPGRGRQGKQGLPLPCRLFGPAALGGASYALAAGPSTRALADTCAMCHSATGKDAIDNLDGMSAREFREEMEEFRREGKGRIMAVIAKAYTDEQIRQMAEYFQSLPKQREER